MLEIKTTKNKHQNHTVEAAIKDVAKTKEKLLVVKIPEKLHADFKSKVALNGSKMTEELIKMISNYI